MSKTGDFLRSIFKGSHSEMTEAQKEMAKLQAIVADPKSTAAQKEAATEIYRKYLSTLAPDVAAMLTIANLNPDVPAPAGAATGTVDWNTFYKDPLYAPMWAKFSLWRKIQYHLKHMTYIGWAICGGALVIIPLTIWGLVVLIKFIFKKR